MSVEEYDTLSLGLDGGHSLRMMATVLGRAPSTLSRESTRNTAQGRLYRACMAQMLAVSQACQSWRPRKLLDLWLWQYVRIHLGQGCLPKQSVGRVQRTYPDDMGKQLSTETIYAALCMLLCGTNQNAKELLRQYLPKGTDLLGYTRRELNALVHRLHTRPRKYLVFSMLPEVYVQLRHHSPVAHGT